MTIRLAVACDPNHCDLESQSVLEWSVRKNTSSPVEITWVKLSRDPDDYGYGWATEKWTTSFSGLRWGLAQMYGFEGHYIYCDSDLIFLGDLTELWEQPFEPRKVVMGKGGGSWRYCVSKWDAAAALDHIPPLPWLRAEAGSHQRMSGYFKERPELTQAFDGDWNSLDGEGHGNLLDGSLKGLHYTSINTQPQLRYAIPRLQAQGRKHWFDGQIKPHPRPDVEALFDTLLAEAIENGYGPQRYAQGEPYGDFKKQSLVGYRGRPAT
jgi:hypothetical protein